MKGPYFITTLTADVRVHPSQMNNNIVENIKRNMEKSYLGRCYENFGIIEKIYDLASGEDPIKDGYIRAEDNTSSSVHSVKFVCRICNPIKNSTIMCKITGINNMIIVAENGPIKVIISATGGINTKNIQFKKSAFYPVSSHGEIINKPISQGTYVMITISNRKLVKNDTKIIAVGLLESVITDNEAMKILRSQYEDSEKVVASDLENLDSRGAQRDSEEHEITMEDEGVDMSDEESDD